MSRDVTLHMQLPLYTCNTHMQLPLYICNTAHAAATGAGALGIFGGKTRDQLIVLLKVGAK